MSRPSRLKHFALLLLRLSVPALLIAYVYWKGIIKIDDIAGAVARHWR